MSETAEHSLSDNLKLDLMSHHIHGPQNRLKSWGQQVGSAGKGPGLQA